MIISYDKPPSLAGLRRDYLFMDAHVPFSCCIVAIKCDEKRTGRSEASGFDLFGKWKSVERANLKRYRYRDTTLGVSSHALCHRWQK